MVTLVSFRFVIFWAARFQAVSSGEVRKRATVSGGLRPTLFQVASLTVRNLRPHGRVGWVCWRAEPTCMNRDGTPYEDRFFCRRLLAGVVEG